MPRMDAKVKLRPPSRRTQEIIELMLEGHGQKTVADRLGISQRTVEYHLGRERARQGVSRSYQLLLRNDGRERKRQLPVVIAVRRNDTFVSVLAESINILR